MQPVLLTIEDQVAYVTLNRPEKRNAMNLPMIKELLLIGRQLQHNRKIRAVVIQGDSSSFCAGIDFKDFTKSRSIMLWSYLQTWVPWINPFQRVNLIWQAIPVPVIAVVEGYCYGAGMQLALGADWIFSGPNGEFSIMESKLGLIPDMGLTQTLRHRIPLPKVKELTMTGRVLSANEALDCGLIDTVADEPHVRARELIHQITLRSPDAVAAAKHLLNDAWGASIRGGLRMERLWQRRLLVHPSQKRSMRKIHDNSVTFDDRSLG